MCHNKNAHLEGKKNEVIFFLLFSGLTKLKGSQSTYLFGFKLDFIYIVNDYFFKKLILLNDTLQLLACKRDNFE